MIEVIKSTPASRSHSGFSTAVCLGHTADLEDPYDVAKQVWVQESDDATGADCPYFYKDTRDWPLSWEYKYWDNLDRCPVSIFVPKPDQISQDSDIQTLPKLFSRTEAALIAAIVVLLAVFVYIQATRP